MKKNISMAKVGGVLLAALLTAFTPSVRAQLTNPGFESGTGGWSVTSGDTDSFTTTTSLPGINQTINPTQGSQFGVISAYGVDLFDGVDTETVSQTFTVGASGVLSLDYRFLSDALNVPAYNPSAQITLSPSIGSPISLVSISRNDLQADPANGGPLSAGAAYNVGGLAVGQDAWHSASLDLSSLVGQQVTLSFSVSEDSFPDDSFLNTELAIDNLAITPAPEPGTLVLAGAGLILLFGIQKFRNGRSS